MDLKLQRKSVLIMAASKGLGKATALEFAREGAYVTIASRNPDNLLRARDDIERETGAAVTTVVADVASAADIENAVRVASARTGGVDVLVTNAGGPPAGSFDMFDDQAWQTAYENNLLSVIRLIRAALPSMRAGKSGRIVNLTSVSIKQPLNDLLLSNVFRAGVYALTKSLAAELGKDGILINTVAPGRIETERIVSLDRRTAEQAAVPVETVRQKWLDQIPLGRYGTPEEFAKTVVFLGSFANTYVTGQALLVDGGMVKAL